MPRLAQNKSSKKKSTDDKLTASIKGMKKIGFRSINDFIIAYYSSTHGAQSLRSQEGKSYGPAKILDAWTANVPNGAEEALHMSIVNKTSEILLREAKRAAHTSELKLTSEGKGDLNFSCLTSDAGLDDIQNCYLNILPCLCTLLYALLTAPNDYETWNHTEKKGKFKAAYKVSKYLISRVCIQIDNFSGYSCYC